LTWQASLINAAANIAALADKHRDWAATLTPDEKEALRAYRTPGVYYILNKFLRSGELPPQKPWQHFTPEGLRDLAYLLDAALRRAPTLDQPVVVYRSVVLPNRLSAQGPRLNGQWLEDRGFMSTTIAPEVIKTFEQKRLTKPDQGHSPVCVAITIPAGASAAYIEAALGGSGEQEVLLPLGKPCGQALRFTSDVETIDGISLVAATLVPDGAKANWHPAFPAGWKPTGFSLRDFFDT